MSEGVGCGTSSPTGRYKVGSVGQALSGVEISVAGDGELLMRGPVVMRGYRHQPEKTAEAIDADGWLHTGDIGTIDSQGFVTIVDRKKELLVNERERSLPRQHRDRDPGLVCPDRPGSGIRRRQALCHGTGRPRPGGCRRTGRRARHGRFVGWPPSRKAARRREMLTAAVREGNAKLSRVEQIKRFLIVGTPWEPGGDELTPTMKLKRRPIAEKYSAETDKLYAATPGPDVINLSD